MARYSPVLPLIGGGNTKFQPVYRRRRRRSDRPFGRRRRRGRPGSTSSAGPNVLTFRQCMEQMLEVIDRKRMLVPVPWWVARIQGAVLGMLPKPLLTRDQVTLLKIDNVVSAGGREGAPHLRRPRHPAAIDRGHPADLSLALPPGRPVHRQKRSVRLYPAWTRPQLSCRRHGAVGCRAPRRRELLHLGADRGLRHRRRHRHAGADGPVRSRRRRSSPCTARCSSARTPAAPGISAPSCAWTWRSLSSPAAWSERSSARFLVVQLPDALLKLVLGGFILVLTWARSPASTG